MNATQLCEIWVSLIWKLQSKPFLWGDFESKLFAHKKAWMQDDPPNDLEFQVSTTCK